MEGHPDPAGPEPADGAGSRGDLGSTEGRYRALLNAIPDLIFHLDREGRFLDFVSPKGEQLAIAPGEFLGRTVSELLPEDLARRVTHHIEQALQTGETQVFRCRFPVPLPDGNLRDYEARIAASGTDEVVAIARDITPSRRTQSALRESEARYRQVFENVHDVFYHMNMNGVLTEVSPSAKWWGYDPEQLVGAPAVIMYEDPEERSALLEVLLEQGSVADFEIRLKARDGRVMDASVSSHVVRDENGVAVAIEGIARDITPRKQAERALRQSEERLRALVTNAPVIMFAIDSEGLFTAAEGTAMSLVGPSPDEHIGRCVFDLYSELPGVCDAARRALAGEAFTTIVELETLTFEANVSPIWDEDSKIKGAVAVATDITERARAEEALRESEETFRGLAEGSIDGIAFSEGVKVLFANAALVKMLGYGSDAEIVGRRFTELVSPEYRELMLERGRARDEGREAPARYEVRALRKDGSEFDAEVSVSTTTYQGRPARQGVIRDISERKRAELALRESEERFRRLSEATQEGIAIHEGSLILDANQQGAAMLGYDLQEIIGMDAFRFIAPESHDLVRQHIASGYEGTYEVLALRKDGATLPVEFCGRPALYQGRPIRIGVMRDISERKRAEEALQRARDELETRVERRMGRAARYKLTFRELAVLYLVAEGMADKEIAFRLGISPRTASKHVENILGKMRATSRTEAGVHAIQEGLVERLK